jgi:hypothetical protein
MGHFFEVLSSAGGKGLRGLISLTWEPKEWREWAISGDIEGGKTFIKQVICSGVISAEA